MLPVYLFFMLASPAPGTSIDFQYIVLDPNAASEGFDTKVAVDVDNDGDQDMVMASKDGKVLWYENPSLAKHVLLDDPARGWSTDAEGADVDGDGYEDIVIGDWYGDALWWLENPGGSGSWSQRYIGQHRPHDLEVSDFDGDGDVDVVSRDVTWPPGGSTGEGVPIKVWRQDSPTSWALHVITSVDGEGLTIGDLDLDGDDDIVIGGRWYENTGTIQGSWPQHVFATNIGDNHVLEVADMNGDGRPDIVLTPAETGGVKLSWFASPADPRQGSWSSHVIEQADLRSHTLQIADMDRDGDLDVVTAEFASCCPRKVRVYLNEASSTSWQPVVVSDLGSHNLQLVDLGNDGDLDMFGANHFATRVDLWENLTPAPPSGGLVGYWPFDEGGGNQAGDASGNGLTGTISGAQWSTGRVGGALQFDGGDWVQVADAAPLRITGDITIAAWVFKDAPNDGGRWDAIVAKAASSAWDYELLTSKSASDQPAFYADVTTPQEVYAGLPFPVGEWHHLAVTRGGSTVRFWVDGEAVATRTMSGSFAATSKPLRIGHDVVQGMIGRLDEVRLYDRALSASEIAALAIADPDDDRIQLAYDPFPPAGDQTEEIVLTFPSSLGPNPTADLYLRFGGIPCGTPEDCTSSFRRRVRTTNGTLVYRALSGFAGQTMTFFVRAVDGAGQVAWSDFGTIRFDP